MAAVGYSIVALISGLLTIIIASAYSFMAGLILAPILPMLLVIGLAMLRATPQPRQSVSTGIVWC